MTPEMRQFTRRVFAAVLIIGLAAAVIYSVEILLLTFAGILLALLLRASGTWLRDRTRLSTSWAMALVLAGFVALFFGTILTFGVQIAHQTDQLFLAISQAYLQFHDKLAQFHVAGGFAAGGLNLETPARAAAPHIFRIAASMVLVLFLGVYLSTSPELYTDLFLSFFGRPLQGRIAGLLDSIAAALRWWLAGQLISMAIVGGLTITGMLLVGAPMAIPLGVMAALLTFVPFVGSILSAVPAVLLAFTRSPQMALWVVLIYLVAHVVEGYIVSPMVQQRLVYLPPALILAVQFLMDLFAGTIGVMFATPLMVVGMVLIKELYFKQEWTEEAA
ncbi:MAG TPA: AI-2E family transporter [Terriglobia bacterium]|jgi:predicted PurR-regulated permease PerM